MDHNIENMHNSSTQPADLNKKVNFIQNEKFKWMKVTVLKLEGCATENGQSILDGDTKINSQFKN